MNALTCESRRRWAQPTLQKGATNRIAVLAEHDNDGAANIATHASGIHNDTTVRSANLGRKKESKLVRCSRKVLAHPRAASPIPDEIGGDQIGVRGCQGYSQIRIPLGGGCGDSKEYVAQVGFMRASCPTRVASTRLQMLASRKFGFITDVKLSLTVASQMAAGGIRVTFKAQGGEFENKKTGRKMTLVRSRGIYVLRMWIAAIAPDFPGPET